MPAKMIYFSREQASLWQQAEQAAKALGKRGSVSQLVNVALKRYLDSKEGSDNTWHTAELKDGVMR